MNTKETTIDAVVFDWGGVLIEDPAPGLMAYCADYLGVSVAAYAPVHNRYGLAFQEGTLQEPEFWQCVCRDVDADMPDLPSLWTQAFTSVYRLRATILEWAATLQSRGVKTALLSNTEPPLQVFFAQQKYTQFDVQVFSCAEGLMKPESEIYRRTIERLGVPAHKVVFFDDRPEFVQGAEAVGIHGRVFASLDRAAAELRTLGIFVL
ncbi:HAD family hydrolase [Planctomycetota bacterium]